MTSKTALLIIDVQTSMFDPEQPPHAAEQVLANVGGLLERARESGTDVIYVRHHHARYEPMMPGHPGFEIQSSIAPDPGELVIDKRACDAFHGTPLESTLRERGIEHVVIAGMQTELCVDTACRSALHRDFNV